MFGLNRKIKELSREGGSIKIGLAGMGQMGKGLLSHLMELEGMEVLAVSDRNMEKITVVLEGMNIKTGRICRQEPRNPGKDKLDSFMNRLLKDTEAGIYKTGDIPDLKSNFPAVSFDTDVNSKIRKCISEGKIIVSSNLEMLFQIEDIDVIIDATGNPRTGAIIALKAITAKKHLVTLNVEMDVTIGPILKKLADSAGVVYTISAGDEPAALKELYDFATSLGFEVIAAGKGKNNPLDREANPDTLSEYARSKGSSAYMMTSFVDGTKSMIEMACMSNATGLVPDCRGMHGPHSNIDSLLDVFKPRDEGGILNRTGIVDFVIGDLAPGVFLVYTTKNAVLRAELKYLLFGEGPYYLLYRPYHLTSMETPISIASAYFYGEPTIVPMEGLVSEVITMAKKDLREGESIDRIGGYTVYGLIEKYRTASRENLLPIGLAEGAILKKDIEKNNAITYNDVNLPGKSIIRDLRRLQGKLLH